jgi:hypothetical protein
VKRVVITTVAAAAMVLLGAGTANAADFPIWALPGLDIGSVLGPTVPVPTEVLAPVDGLLKFISG